MDSCPEFEPELQADISLFTEEYFGEREEEERLGSESPSDSSGKEESDSNEAFNAINLELRDVDKEKEKAVQSFISNTCGCSLKEGNPCSGYFDVPVIRERRMMMAELYNSQLDCVILGQISTHHFSDDLTGHSSKGKSRAHSYSHFFYQSHKICLKTFLFLNHIGRKRYQNLMKHYQKCGISPRRHGNEKRRPWNASSFPDKERAVNFIKNFAEVHALPLPGRMPKFYDFNIMLLPTDSSKASVHREYVTASKELEKRLKQPVRCYRYREFCRVWLEVVPYIRVMPPASDLCALCQENATLILKSANLSEDEKTKLLTDAQEHLKFAKLQRAYYNECVKSSQSNTDKVQSGEQPMAKVLSLSYSFDHAQQLHYPSKPLQPGPLYFKTPRKCGVFGVCSEGENFQLNYLIDEAQACGKGANSIVSMVHHFLQFFSHQTDKICLQADNCVGQNKNNIMTSYLAWRITVGLNHSCELNFMIPGHTKFSPDRFFGLIKRKYRHTNVSSLIEIAEVVKTSTTGGNNKVYVIGNEDEQSTKPFHYYNWADFLSSFCQTIPQITSYHHFRFEKDHPGIVFVHEFADSKVKALTIIKPGTCINSDSLLSEIFPSGLSEERKQYFLSTFDHSVMRSFVI